MTETLNEAIQKNKAMGIAFSRKKAMPRSSLIGQLTKQANKGPLYLVVERTL